MKNKHTANKWVYTRVKPFIPWIIFISSLNIVASLTYVFLAKLSQNIIDTANSNITQTFILGSIFLFGLILLHITLEAAVSVISTSVATKMNIQLKNYMFTAIMRKKYVDVSKYHSGDLLNRVTGDIDAVQSSVVNIIPNIVSMLTKIVGCITALVMLEPRVAFLVLIVGIIVPAFGRILSKYYKHLHKETQRTEGESRSFMQECFENISIMKTFRTESVGFIFKYERGNP